MISLQILVLSQSLEFVPNSMNQVILLAFQILSLKVCDEIMQDFNERNQEVA